MNKLYIGIMLLGLLNIVILMTNLVLILEFKNFKDISEAWNKMVTGQSKTYHAIIEQYKDMTTRYVAQGALFDKMCMHYDTITSQYKTISELQDEYRKLCNECIDRYGDAYEQFKLCSDKLDKIFQPQVSVSPKDFEADDEDIAI